jgi:hypothetical protein
VEYSHPGAHLFLIGKLLKRHVSKGTLRLPRLSRTDISRFFKFNWFLVLQKMVHASNNVMHVLLPSSSSFFSYILRQYKV